MNMKLTKEYIDQIVNTLNNKSYCFNLCDKCFMKAFHGTVAGCNPSLAGETAEKIRDKIEELVIGEEV
jgi:hypothetical protein